VGSNRGALPFHQLSKDEGALRVLVPLPADEALWVAWTVKPGFSVSGFAAANIALRITPVSQSRNHGSLLAADALLGPDGPRALDASSLAVARTRRALSRDHLQFDVLSDRKRVVGRMGIVVATPALYARLSGLPPPSPSTPSDAYGGWRLA
jgi:hypothetical protein